MKSKGLLLVALLLAMLSGCASYSCGAPQGTSCRSVADVYDARELGSLPHQQVNQPVGNTSVATVPARDPMYLDGWQDDTKYPVHQAAVPMLLHDGLKPRLISVEPGDALLSRPKVLRVWIRPWEDKDDLHDEQYVYLRLDRGSWLLTGGESQP